MMFKSTERDSIYKNSIAYLGRYRLSHFVNLNYNWNWKILEILEIYI